MPSSREQMREMGWNRADIDTQIHFEALVAAAGMKIQEATNKFVLPYLEDLKSGKMQLCQYPITPNGEMVLAIIPIGQVVLFEELFQYPRLLMKLNLVTKKSTAYKLHYEENGDVHCPVCDNPMKLDDGGDYVCRHGVGFGEEFLCIAKARFDVGEIVDLSDCPQ
jgi:hypothetical protein